MLAAGKTRPEPGIEIFERPEPKITQEDEVLIEVGACGVCGTDVRIYRWRPEEMSARILNMKFPRVLGHEVAGTIRQMGKNVAGFAVGDKVMCEASSGCGLCVFCRSGRPHLCETRRGRILGIGIDGGYTQYMIIRSACLFKMSEDISFIEAAVMESFGVAVHALERSHLKPGDHVVILGPGPLGLLGAMLAKSNGAASVIVAGLGIDKERLKIASKIGAEAIDITAHSLSERVLSNTNGKGADVVFDFAGGVSALKGAIEVVSKGGEVIMVGQGKPGEFDQKTIVDKELTILGVKARQPSTWDRAMALLDSRTIDLKPIITHTFPVKKAKEAFQLLDERKAVKVVIVP